MYWSLQKARTVKLCMNFDFYSKINLSFNSIFPQTFEVPRMPKALVFLLDVRGPR